MALVRCRILDHAFILMAMALGLAASALLPGQTAVAASAETWQLVKREYPVLPESITSITTGRNAGSFIRIRRTTRRNEVVYIRRDVVRGVQQCLWHSRLVWDENLPTTIVTGRQVMIQLQAFPDRQLGGGCNWGRIGVTYGTRAEPLRERAPNVRRIRGGLAAAGGTAPRASTEIFTVDARPDLPGNDLFTVAIHVSDGGITDQVVALYVYQKVRGASPPPAAPPVTRPPGVSPPVSGNIAGPVVRLESYNYPGMFIRHRNFLGELTRLNSGLDTRDATFRIVPGLANSSLVSFESVNYPGYYLRHQGFRIKLMRGQGDALFRNDATFRRVPGLANSSMVSFESVNYPGHFIRHRNFHLYLESGSGDLFRKDATFRFAAFGR